MGGLSRRVAPPSVLDSSGASRSCPPSTPPSRAARGVLLGGLEVPRLCTVLAPGRCW